MEYDYSKMPGLQLNRQPLTMEVQPLVSIITPYYNAAAYFEQTYRCIINQTFPWFEWIIVDDGSTSECDLKLLAEVENRDSRIKVLHKENGGISTARNLAIKESRTELIVPIDADDLMEPTYLDCMYFGLLYNKDCDWCYTNSIGFQNIEYTWDQKFDANRLKTYNFLTYSGMIRKQALLEVGCYDESEKHCFEDWHCWLKLLSAHKKPLKLSFYGFWYRRLDQGVLQLVSNDKNIKKRAMKLIIDQAKKVDVSVQAKAYPCGNVKEQFLIPEKVHWNKKVSKNLPGMLMIIPWMQMGGADLFNLEFIEGMRRSYSITLVTTLPDTNIWRQRFQEYIDEIYELPSFLDVSNYAVFLSYLIESRDIKIVFLSQSYYGYYVLPWLRMNYPDLVITDFMHIEEQYWRNGGYARTTQSLEGILDCTFVCCEQTRQRLISYYGKKEQNIKTIYIGVDLRKFSIEQRKEQKLPIDSMLVNKKVVLFPCRFCHQKRPLLMLRIAKKLHEIDSSYVFLAVGYGPLLEEMRTYCNKNQLDQIVYFTGRAQDMVLYYQRADITLICSMKEGLSLTAYESLAMGVPVVSADVGGQRELIDDEVGRLVPLLQSEKDEITSYDYSDEEINSYVNAIVDIMSRPSRYDNMSLIARKRIEENFSTECMIEHMEDEFSRLFRKEYTELRITAARELGHYSNLVNDYLTLYQEYSIQETCSSDSDLGMKSELLRIMNSRLGKKLIHLAFKLKLNKLF